MSDDETIELTASDVDLARRWSDAIAKLGALHRPDLDYRNDSFFYGYLGELAARRWFVLHGILHTHRVWLTGKSAPFDFLVWRNDQPKRLEVKTATQPTHVRFMIPTHQALDSDVYVGARIESTEPYVVRLMGMLVRAEIEQLPIGEFSYGPTRWKLHAEMHPMFKLARCLDPVRQMVSPAHGGGLSVVSVPMELA